MSASLMSAHFLRGIEPRALVMQNQCDATTLCPPLALGIKAFASWIRNCLSEPHVCGHFLAPQDGFQRLGFATSFYLNVSIEANSLSRSLSLSLPPLPTNEFEETWCLMMISLDDEGDDPDDDAAAAIDDDEDNDDEDTVWRCWTQLRSTWANRSQCNNTIGRSQCNNLINANMRVCMEIDNFTVSM